MDGQEFTGKLKRLSWERLWTFSGGPFTNTGWPKKNLHTDSEFARECGSPVAASGTQSQGYVVRLMIDLFGKEWLSHGTMDVRFVGMGGVDDVLVSKAVVKSKEVSVGATKFFMDVWVENRRGDKILIGSATDMVMDQ